MKCKEKKSCRACGSSNLKTVLNLHNQPLANSYHKPDEGLDEYPLKLNICPNCYHAQLSVVVDPDEMFKNYLYVSGTTTTLKKYFDDFYNLVSHYIELPETKRVLEIGCNDGTQLEVFKRRGWETYGIDPAENLYEISSKKGFKKIICDYFNEMSASALRTKMDLIIAQNVLAHTDDIHDFLQCCKLISHENTKIFIQTSQANMFANNEFDTIYHEHLSFFCTNSMNTCVQKNDLYIEDVLKTDVHGTSYIFVLSGKKNSATALSTFLAAEEKEGKHSFKFYKKFAAKADKIVIDLKNCIIKHKNKGYVIVGYGAAAKANTLLNFGAIDLDFIVDDNPMKQGLLTPGRNIRIKDATALRSDKKMLIIPLAWNFYNEISKRIAKERNNPEDIFVKYFPELTLEHNK